MKRCKNVLNILLGYTNNKMRNFDLDRSKWKNETLSLGQRKYIIRNNIILNVILDR